MSHPVSNTQEDSLLLHDIVYDRPEFAAGDPQLSNHSAYSTRSWVLTTPMRNRSHQICRRIVADSMAPFLPPAVPFSPAFAAAWRGRDGASGPDQFLHGLWAIGRNWPQCQRKIPSQLTPGLYQIVQGLLNVGLDLVRRWAFRCQSRHIRAGDCVYTIGTGLKV